jgi:hypothetical protein
LTRPYARTADEVLTPKLRAIWCRFSKLRNAYQTALSKMTKHDRWNQIACEGEYFKVEVRRRRRDCAVTHHRV